MMQAPPFTPKALVDRFIDNVLANSRPGTRSASSPVDTRSAALNGSKKQLDAVATLCALIIPVTETPGARAALVDRFVDTVLANSRPADKERFVTGLTWMDTRSAALNGGKAFTAATPEQQTALLTRLAADSRQDADDLPGVPFFNAVKGMTIAGYYSTQIGLEKELGDSGQLFNPTFVGCTHPEHQR